MRRLRQSLKRTYYVRKYASTKNAEGSTCPAWGDAVEIKAIIRNASGKLAVEQYGERLSGVLKMQYEGKEPIGLQDGICVHVPPESDPDYQVVAVKYMTDNAFRVYELEAI